MVYQVIPAQRLLQHHQVKAVEQLELRQVGKAVRAVRIHHEGDFGESLAHTSQHFHVPSRLDFHLDALVTGVQLLLDLIQ